MYNEYNGRYLPNFNLCFHTTFCATFMDSPATKRFDLFAPIHETVRHFIVEVTTLVAALDVTDLNAIAHCAGRVERLFGVLHCDDAEVKPLLKALFESDMTLRRDAAANLCSNLNQIVSNQLVAQQHLQITRTSLLRATHTEADLRAMRYHRLAAMSDEELAEALRGIEVALNLQEITALLKDVQTNVSPQYFDHLLGTLSQLTIAPRLRQSAREFGVSKLEQRPEDIQPSRVAQRPRGSGRAHRATRRRTSSQ